MPMTSIRRRVGRLAECFTVPRDYPPLTRAEVEDLALRIRTGGQITGEEIERVESKGSVVRGEYVMHVAHGRLTYKRYVGIDLEVVL
jgi:hypothetical protein